MNARDNIKPKSIRLAILEALADGQITTIDDLLLRIEESRKKVVENAGAAANEGLVKRMRDDVTNQAAYQITADGRKYIAKYADGKKDEPTPSAESDEVDKEVERRIEKIAYVKPDQKKTEKLAPQPSQTEVIAQKDTEIASLSRRLRDAIEELDRNNKILELHRKAELSWEKSMMETVGEDGVGDVVKAIDSIKASRDNALAELDRANRLFAAACADLGRINEHLGLDPDDGGAEPIIDAIDEIKASLELSRMARTVVHAGYVIQRPVKPLVRFSKIDRAKARALACARAGKKAQVFALVPVGVATPGAEWVAA